MAFLNGKYTAFDPQITIDEVESDENFLITGYINLQGTTATFTNLDKTEVEIYQAQQSGKRLLFTPFMPQPEPN